MSVCGPTPHKKRKTDASVVEEVDVLSGRIESLNMQNFMCHSNLNIVFNKRITFISGRNGSGKSAVVAALVVVLGGSATTTSRASNIGEFVMKGQNQARVTIVLLNDGANAYKPELYGEKIMITRSFTKNGGTSYTFKAMDGSVISNKKSEVDRICEALNLQIKNPICILNQDIARSFLSTANPTIRFNIFMAATQLDELQKFYSVAHENIKKACTDLEKKAEVIKEQKKDVIKATQKSKFLEELDNKAEQKDMLEKELLWAAVGEQEKKLQTILGQIEINKTHLTEIHASRSNHSAWKTEQLEIINNHMRTLEEAKERSNDAAKHRMQLRQRLRTVENECKDRDEKLSRLKQTLKRREDDLHQMTEFLNKLDQNAEDSEAQRVRIKKKMKELKNEISEVEARLETARRDLDNADETSVTERRKIDDLNEEINIINQNKRHTETKLQSTQTNEDPLLIRLGPDVPKLCKEIEKVAQQGGFLVRPVGPLVKYVNLNCDSKWAVAIEQAVGRLLTSFCCDNHQDENTLINLMNKFNMQSKPPIIVSKFQKGRHNINTRTVRPSRGSLRLVDSLKISNDVVFNALVDQACIESILLFDNDQQASQLCSHIENVPQGFRLGYTVAGDKFCPAPSYRSYAGPGAGAFPRYFNLHLRQEDMVSKLQENFRTQASELEVKRQQLKDVKERLMKLNEFKSHTSSRLRELNAKKVALTTEMQNLKEQEATMPVLAQRAALEEDQCNLQRAKEEIENEIASFTQKQGSSSLKNELNAEIVQVQRKETALQSKITELQNEIDVIQTKLRQKEQWNNNVDVQIKNTTSVVNDLAKQKEQVQAVLAEREKIAQERCATRVNTKRDVGIVRRELDQCIKYLKAAENIGGTRQQIIEECRTLYESYAKLRTNRDNLKATTEFFKKKILVNLSRYHTMETYVETTIQRYFTACLGTRGYEGFLNIDFTNKTLNLEVTPRCNEGPGRSDSKTLSGGERSYSMVSLILALWQECRTPFYFLDEFDVFMDKINRKVILDLLLSNAEYKTNHQFVFITPQDISSIHASDITTIYKMPDPVRSAN